jgi:hypothetical protein
MTELSNHRRRRYTVQFRHDNTLHEHESKSVKEPTNAKKRLTMSTKSYFSKFILSTAPTPSTATSIGGTSALVRAWCVFGLVSNSASCFDPSLITHTRCLLYVLVSIQSFLRNAHPFSLFEFISCYLVLPCVVCRLPHCGLFTIYYRWSRALQ